MLEQYNFPKDIKQMSIEELNSLSIELREFLLEKVSKTGGHLASNLGVCELSMALLKVFDMPKDKLVWDVGHQSYIYKILTGRKDQFDTLRKIDGLSGFPKRRESEFDVFDSGHSSVSIAVASGIAEARDKNKDDYEVIAVIGDGALTGGQAYEALNNAGASKSKLIVILNDNNMSITANKGGVANHLGKLRTSKAYYDFKKLIKSRFKDKSNIYQGLERFRDSIKFAIVDGGAMFEELGFTYLGPVDGHNISDLIEALEVAKQAEGPILLHVLTKKGKGYTFAEDNPAKFHGIGPFDIKTGETISNGKRTYSDVFGDCLTNLALKDENIVAISAAMIHGTGLEKFAKILPERCYDVGIAEGYAVSFAAGLALEGKKPCVTIYSTFLQRAYDQMMLDVCMQNLPVVFAIDRAGIVGNDGETHHGIFDLSYLNSMPNMTVLAPKDGRELEEMLKYAFSLNSPVAIRYPRGEALADLSDNYDLNASERMLSGKDADIWAVGKSVSIAKDAIEILKEKGYEVGLVNARFENKIDKEKVSKEKLIITMEDNVINGGFGSLMNTISKNTLNIAWPNEFIPHGDTNELFKRYRMDKYAVAERIIEAIERKA